MRKNLLVVFALIAILILSVTSFARSTRTSTSSAKNSTVSESAKAQRRISKLRHSRRVRRTASRRRRFRYREHFDTSSFDDNNTVGDVTAGEDPVVRAAAMDALGNYNGTVLAIDPSTGRVLSMVNQKLALSEGAEPCSTIKVAVGLAALSERIVSKDTMVPIGSRARMSLTQALARSNNTYFEVLGRRLGFEKVRHYANLFGLGELAGYNIEGEHLGIYPDEELDSKLGGVGRMCSFGESISLTPLQLGALVAAMANGGTLYYLQHPNTPEEVLAFEPKMKRVLDISNVIPEMVDGMSGAVQYGTARLLRTSFAEEPVLGKTGTCSNNGTRYGWFASYADTDYGRIVTVVFLRGGHEVFGPKAAEIAGRLYRNLYDHSYFAVKSPGEKTSTTNTVGASQ
jgi:penicillin-binding protein 2